MTRSATSTGNIEKAAFSIVFVKILLLTAASFLNIRSIKIFRATKQLIKTGKEMKTK